MTDPFLGEIRIFGCSFAPQGWAQCNGQIMLIQQNTALYSLLGTLYGGNGITTYGLPNLQGSVPVHQGQGTGLSPYINGQIGGSPTTTLLPTQVPAHTHAFQASALTADLNIPSSQTALGRTTPAMIYKTPAGAAAAQQMAAGVVRPNGNGVPHNNMMPFLTLNFCIAVVGTYPVRP